MERRKPSVAKIAQLGERMTEDHKVRCSIHLLGVLFSTNINKSQLVLFLDGHDLPPSYPSPQTGIKAILYLSHQEKQMTESATAKHAPKQELDSFVGRDNRIQ